MTDQNMPRSTDDEIQFSLQPYLDTLRAYRQIILLSVATVGAIFLVAAAAVWIVAPSEHTNSVQFRFLFEGAESGHYPNDSPFSANEIVAAPVVSEVYRQNDLSRFGAYDAFKGSLSVQQSNPALELLTYQFQARLADTRLTQVERARIEDEYAARRAALNDPTYTLVLRRSERFKELPPALSSKVLGDLLATWAAQAQAQKGVLSYSVPILINRIITRDDLERLDYLVAADRLRTQSVRLMRAIDETSQLAGAQTFRAKEGSSLPELRARLDDDTKFTLEPLIGWLRTERISRDPRSTQVYVEARAFALELDEKQAAARLQALKTAFADYAAQASSNAVVDAAPKGATPSGAPSAPVLMPQLSESFLERLQNMSVLTQKGELEYRRRISDQTVSQSNVVAIYQRELEYYRELQRQISALPLAGRGENVDASKRLTAAFEALDRDASQLVNFFTEFSAQTLDPEARLYAFTGPFVDVRRRTVPIERFGVGLILALFVATVLACVAVLLYDAVRRRPQPALQK